jgi:hypothetical protein
MQLFKLAMGCFFIACLAGAEELRTWTGVKGNRVEAAFVKIDGFSVLLKRKDGTPISAKLADLCEEDRAYVQDLTYVPRDVVVLFKKKSFGNVCEESGSSPVATRRDTVTIRLADERDDKKAETIGDSRWKIESVDALGNRIKPVAARSSRELVTEGKFVFVTYTVENDSNLPMTVPSPIMVDKRGRKFLQVAKADAKDYLSANVLLAGTDTIQPGFKKVFCAFYEMPLDAEPAIVEVFPSKASSYAIEQFEAKGKQIVLDGGASAVSTPKPADGVNPAATADKKASVFLKCVRVGQGGDTSSDWYYDRNKKRSLSYGVELRALGAQQQNVKVKAFFIGIISSNNKEAVVDKQEQDVVLEPGKIARVTLQSKEVEEFTYYYYAGSRMNGAKLKGIIVQVWRGDDVVSSFVSVNQWKKYAESDDLVKQMGELTVSSPGGRF